MIQRRSDVYMGTCCWGRGIPMGYALWEYTGNAWELRKDASIPGAQPSDPPQMPGLFRGQIRATPSIVMMEQSS
ncbi:MAG: hypothetical protein KDA69_03395 [Planctomycetaceae bacterium]|nr:hypothetical protein [Planctomycetaceae bacterium]MCA9030438.1 hypothetical protein [Planctomycetaceae bacterium]MCA9043336.1 hypothetical protein [Planctomycetaceae bacterium]MCB9952827.1 hypothetical protein [Planctomycetaceae bacterium]